MIIPKAAGCVLLFVGVNLQALNVTFSSIDYSASAGDENGLSESFFSGDGGGFSHTGRGSTVASSLSFSHDLNGSTVQLDGTISIGPRGYYAYTTVNGRFTLDEAAYVSGYGIIDSNSGDSGAISYISVNFGDRFEIQEQRGQSPDQANLSNSPMYGNGDVDTPQLLAPGSYSFRLWVKANDHYNTSISFESIGYVGLRFEDATPATPVPEGGSSRTLLLLALVALCSRRRMSISLAHGL